MFLIRLACKGPPVATAVLRGKVPDKSWYALLIVLTVFGCNPKPAAGPVRNEVVMSPGMKIAATTPTGTITITAEEGHHRSYTWSGQTRSAEMRPRKERWHGSLGIYYPGPGYHWADHEGIRRGVLQEGQQHFASEKEALRWIAAQRKFMPLVYRSDGLAVGWLKVPERKQLNVDVWQILIGGKKPVALEGGDDQAIEVVTD